MTVQTCREIAFLPLIFTPGCHGAKHTFTLLMLLKIYIRIYSLLKEKQNEGLKWPEDEECRRKQSLDEFNETTG